MLEPQVSSTFIEKYLNIKSTESRFDKLSRLCANIKPCSAIITEISNYQSIYNQQLRNPTLVKEYLTKLISEHINNNYQKINVLDADINYFLKGVLESYNEKFNSILCKMNINHIIKMIDYTAEKKNDDSTFKVLMNMYFKLFGDKILCGQYGKSNNYLYEQLNDDWSTINFDNLLNFADVLSKLKY